MFTELLFRSNEILLIHKWNSNVKTIKTKSNIKCDPNSNKHKQLRHKLNIIIFKITHLKLLNQKLYPAYL
jgi:hypothetical protein